MSRRRADSLQAGSPIARNCAPGRNAWTGAGAWQCEPEPPDSGARRQRRPANAARRLHEETPGQHDRGLPQMVDGGPPWIEPEQAKTWSYKDEDLWAFHRVRPRDKTKSIDDFITAALRDRGLAPAPQADRRTLIRRATIDLTGLPAAPEEIEAFLRDRSPRAWPNVIERLLASPRYGERWGRHWLDVVRYADSSGYSNDFERPNAWRYRDYVIRSFNFDKPYDRFIREQVAGDEVDAGDAENLIATGFLRMGPWEHTAMSVAAETRQAWLADVT